MSYGLPSDWYIEHSGETRILDQNKVAAEIALLRAALQGEDMSDIVEPLLCAAGGIPYNKAHLDAKESRIRRLQDEIERLRAALKSCIDALDSKEMEGVWQYLYAHGYQYSGPVIDMNAARRALEGKDNETR